MLFVLHNFVLVISLCVFPTQPEDICDDIRNLLRIKEYTFNLAYARISIPVEPASNESK